MTIIVRVFFNVYIQVFVIKPIYITKYGFYNDFMLKIMGFMQERDVI